MKIFSGRVEWLVSSITFSQEIQTRWAVGNGKSEKVLKDHQERDQVMSTEWVRLMATAEEIIGKLSPSSPRAPPVPRSLSVYEAQLSVHPGYSWAMISLMATGIFANNPLAWGNLKESLSSTQRKKRRSFSSRGPFYSALNPKFHPWYKKEDTGYRNLFFFHENLTW